MLFGMPDDYNDESIRYYIEKEKLERKQEMKRAIFWGMFWAVFRWVFSIIAVLASVALITWLLFVIGGNCK